MKNLRPQDNEETPVIGAEKKTKRRDLDDYLNGLAEETTTDYGVDDLEIELEQLSEEKRRPHIKDAVEYWKLKESPSPQLAELANVVLGASCSQVSVERAIYFRFHIF